MFDKRMEKWFILQSLMFVAILVIPPFTQVELDPWVETLGISLFLMGVLAIILALLYLGPNLTPYVKPKEKAKLITNGIYGLVRHPMYLGFFLLALGWSMIWGTPLGILLSCLLFFILDKKAEAEEKWLLKLYPEYKPYQMKVKKIIPFIY